MKKPKVLQQRWWWVVTGATLINGFFAYGIVYSYGVLFGDIQSEFNSTNLITGWVQSLCLGSSQLFTVPGQMLAVKYGYFNVITSAVLLYVISLVLSSFVPSIIYLYITYGVGVGMATAVITKQMIQMVLEWAPVHYRARASTLATLGSTIGLLAVSPLMEILLTRFGWRWTLRVCSGLTFAVGLIITPLIYMTPNKNLWKESDSTTENRSTMRDDNVTDDAEDYKSYPYVTQRKVLLFPETWIFCAMNIVASCAQGFTMINLVDFATKSGFTLGQGTLVLSINGGAEIVGKILLAAFIDKLSFHKILIWPHACIVASVSCILLLYFKSFEAILTISVVIGLVKAIFNSTPHVMALEIFGTKFQASATSLGAAPRGIGFLLAALVGGFSYDLTGSYDSALYSCAGLFFVGTILSISTLLW